MFQPRRLGREKQAAHMRELINAYKNAVWKHGMMRQLGKCWRICKEDTALKWKFQKYELKEWTRFNWFRTGSNNMINYQTR